MVVRMGASGSRMWASGNVDGVGLKVTSGSADDSG